MPDIDEVELAYSLDQLDIHANIKLKAQTWYDEKDNRLPEPAHEMMETTVGRVIFNRILPPEDPVRQRRAG